MDNTLKYAIIVFMGIVSVCAIILVSHEIEPTPEEKLIEQIVGSMDELALVANHRYDSSVFKKNGTSWYSVGNDLKTETACSFLMGRAWHNLNHIQTEMEIAHTNASILTLEVMMYLGDNPNTTLSVESIMKRVSP